MDFFRFEFRPLLSKPSSKRHKKVDKRAEFCWFVRDVTAAMLVIKNKSISLLWDLNSIFM